MMKTIFGGFPVGGVCVGCCPCAGFTSALADSAEAASNVLLLSRSSRRFRPLLSYDIPSLDFPRSLSLLMTRSLSVNF
jgi:hypothetical protein